MLPNGGWRIPVEPAEDSGPAVFNPLRARKSYVLTASTSFDREPRRRVLRTKTMALSMLFCPAFTYRAGSARHAGVKRSSVHMNEAAARAAWLAKQGGGGGGPDSTPQATGEIPPWGAELIDMAEMCNQGTDFACNMLSSEDGSKLAWLLTQPVASPGSKVAAMLGGGGGGGAQGMQPGMQSLGFQSQGGGPGGMPPPGGGPPGRGQGGMQGGMQQQGM